MVISNEVALALILLEVVCCMCGFMLGYIHAKTRYEEIIFMLKSKLLKERRRGND